MTDPLTGTLALDGTRLHYDVAGRGHPLVLAHAGIADRRMWDAQFGALAEHFRVVRYDLRGFGQSPPAGACAHWRDLAALLDHLRLPRAHLLGCSKGGAVCLDFTLEHPERVTGLVLVGTPPSGFKFTGFDPRQDALLEAAFDAGDFEQASEYEVQIWVDGPHRAPGEVPAGIRDRVRAMNAIALRNEAGGLGREQPLEPPALARLGDVRAPTLVITGALDVAVILQAAEVLAREIPGARQAVIPGAAHLPNLERPNEFNRLVLDFLLSLPS